MPGFREIGGSQGVAEDQRDARIFGVLFIITFITSIGALALFQSVLDDPAKYIAGGGKDNQIYLGAFLDFLLIIANVGTAVVLYRIARRQNETLAIGYVAARIIECVFLAAGIIFVLGVVSLTDRGATPPDWEHRRALRLVGPKRLGERPGNPRVHLGGVPWHLLRHLGVQEGLSNPSPNLAR
jgi:hypothetical protein